MEHFVGIFVVVVVGSGGIGTDVVNKLPQQENKKCKF